MNDIDLSDYSDEMLEQLLEEYNLLACQSNDAELYKQSILIPFRQVAGLSRNAYIPFQNQSMRHNQE